MRVITGLDLAVGEWVAKQIEPHYSIDKFWPCTAMGFEKDGELIAGVMYHNYRKTDIELSAAAINERWLSRKNLQEIFNYPYNQLGCIRTTAVTGRKNRRARKLLEGLGYRLEGVCRLGWEGKQDAFIYGMTKDECKWITP